jgi:cytochrome b involved in lipid metabolism
MRGRIVVVSLIISVFLSGCTSINPMKSTSNVTPTPTQELTPIPIEVKQITTDELSSHNKPTDCWLAIDGKVYDVTTFVSRHPGKDAILQGCGKDATSLFESRPGDGSSHSNSARNLLPNFFVGDLKS